MKAFPPFLYYVFLAGVLCAACVLGLLTNVKYTAWFLAAGLAVQLICRIIPGRNLVPRVRSLKIDVTILSVLILLVLYLGQWGIRR